MLEALKEGADLQAEFKAFDAALRAQNPDTVARWEVMVTKFDENSSNPCPYVLKEGNGK